MYVCVPVYVSVCMCVWERDRLKHLFASGKGSTEISVFYCLVLRNLIKMSIAWTWKWEKKSQLKLQCINWPMIHHICAFLYFQAAQLTLKSLWTSSLSPLEVAVSLVYINAFNLKFSTFVKGISYIWNPLPCIVDINVYTMRWTVKDSMLNRMYCTFCMMPFTVNFFTHT